ncbi:MAG: HNH endonuclease [Deltaproteobacteria bacterium]|nr:HNH endonuclease [Deltaproteobacteria bacterium]
MSTDDVQTRNASNGSNVTKLKRNYSQKTLKVLFALSGNQCAHPECTNPLIASPTEESDAFVVAHICHIYAVSNNGARGKSGLTEKELNSPENLILLCQNHHAIVDGQHETYPAETLKLWKQQHETEIQKRLSADIESIQPEVFSHPYFPKALVDQKIEQDVLILRKSRFSGEFDRIQFSIVLAKKLVDGDLSGGTDDIRCRALAWCARILSRSEKSDRAEKFLNFSKSLGSCPEIDIASAFLDSAKGKKKASLTALAGIASPMSRSAALQVVVHHDRAQAAVDWLKNADLTAADLDSDGKLVLLMLQHELAQWEAAQECVEALTDDNFDEAPLLHHMAAMTHLVSTVPNELRPFVLNHLPIEAAGFPLASDAIAIEARRIARKHFIRSAEVALELDCPIAGKIEDEYALWLELRDPDDSADGRKKLESKLRDTKSALRLVHFGLQFGIKLNLEAVNREIDRQIALNGGMTADTAIARFALAFTERSPQAIASYIARYREQLFEQLDKKFISSVEIEMLSRGGLPEKAKKRLSTLVAEGLSEPEASHLRRIISEADGTDPIEARKEQFKKTDRLADLSNLVHELEARGEWGDLCEYGAKLFERTRSLHDAERLSRALSNTQSNERLVEFLKTNSTLLDQSENLRMLYCWSLYHKGALLDARSELARLSGDRDDPNHRALQVNLGIALGDWNSLMEFVANECREKDKRSASDLVGAAQLGFHLGSPNAKELLFAAARKGDDDAGILAAAYFLASSAGWEDDADVYQWLHKAAELSGDDGPIQKMSLKDILDRKPDWDRRESDTWRQLSRGEIPMFVAGQLLNKSLIDLVLFPALANVSEHDPRRRAAVPAYSGVRQPMAFNTGGVVGIEATALLTLSMLDLLDNAFDAFDKVFIPHSTLAWLFEEKQKATFHQPSRIKDAHQLRHLLATDALEKLTPSTAPDSDLSAQVGEELALLISEAERATDDGDPQRIVVRSAPVHRVGSLMEEEADLMAHASIVSSCQSIVNKLRQKGQITAAEEKKAHSYLQLHEKPWPAQPEITDGAVLYLDDLAVTYFLHLGILEKLKAAGFRTILSPRGVSEANQLISYERISSQANDAIERIRSTISSGIESIKVATGRSIRSDQVKDSPITEHPTLSIVTLATHCDAVITDDRFINQHANIDDGKGPIPIFTTLDLIDQFASDGTITTERWLEARTFLRRAGYFFVPVSGEELQCHLKASAVVEGKVIEAAELKAIRENILRVRMCRWLQLPKEAFWLDSLLKTFIRVLKGQWSTGTDISNIVARSNWIMDQIDVRRWAHCLGEEGDDNLVKIGHGAHILLLLSPPTDASPEFKDEYWAWIEERALAPIKEQDSDLYFWILARTREQIAEVADMDLTGEGAK